MPNHIEITGIPRVRRVAPNPVEHLEFMRFQVGNPAPPYSVFEGRSYREDEVAFLRVVDQFRRRYHRAPTLDDALTIAGAAGYRKS
jgi:hypothetical protein